MRIKIFWIFLLSVSIAHASMFGEETPVLLEMVANQLTELQHLSESVGIAKNQIQMIYDINEGVQKVVSQIKALQSIIDRAQGIDPTSIRSLSDINRTIDDMRMMSSEIQDLLIVKMVLCNEAVEEASLQSDTAYKMGQELANTGAELAAESKTASPGRAGQITASASAAQMMAMGVELQTMAQMSQLLAFSLDLQKSQMEKELKTTGMRNSYLKASLTGSGDVERPKKAVYARRRR